MSAANLSCRRHPVIYLYFTAVPYAITSAAPDITLVGGEITGYTEMLNEARQIATKRMVDEAKEMNADAVIGVKYGSSQVMSGAAEVIAYGTAVKYKQD